VEQVIEDVAEDAVRLNAAPHAVVVVEIAEVAELVEEEVVELLAADVVDPTLSSTFSMGVVCLIVKFLRGFHLAELGQLFFSQMHRPFRFCSGFFPAIRSRSFSDRCIFFALQAGSQAHCSETGGYT
jgi:hypothetical protein